MPEMPSEVVVALERSVLPESVVDASVEAPAVMPPLNAIRVEVALFGNGYW